MTATSTKPSLLLRTFIRFTGLSEESVNNPLHFWNMGYPLVVGTLSEEQDQLQLTDSYQMPSISGGCRVVVSQYLLQLCTDTEKSRRAGLVQVFTCTQKEMSFSNAFSCPEWCLLLIHTTPHMPKQDLIADLGLM